MTTRFYNQIKLEGQYIDLAYGTYTLNQISVLPGGIQSINIPQHASVTLYSQDGFIGPRYVIQNNGSKPLKVPGFTKEFPYTVQSLKIDCSCKLITAPGVVYQIMRGTDFTRANQPEISYTLYNVIPDPLTDPKDPPSPYNPTIIIIPDFGTDIRIWECFQEKLARNRFSSLILNLRGVGMSYATTDNTYATIIQDYRYIAQQLGQYTKKPILLGHGIGGAIAQLWALTYKFELRNLILIGSAPYAVYSTYNLLTPSINNWISNLINPTTFGNTVANTVYNVPSEDCQNEKLISDLSSSIISSDQQSLKLLFTQNPDIPPLQLTPKFILVPTLIIHGLQDAATAITGSDSLYNLIKDSKYRKIATGHSPQFTTPERTLESILNFLLNGKKVYMDQLPSCCYPPF
jgi:pimeloyl-ACP methyl ester carboxylesterase